VSLYLRMGPPIKINRQKFWKLSGIRKQDVEWYSTNACLHVPPDMRNWSQRVPHSEQGGGVVLVTDIALTSRHSHSSHTRNCFRKGEGSNFTAPSRCPPLHDSTRYSVHRTVPRRRIYWAAYKIMTQNLASNILTQRVFQNYIIRSLTLWRRNFFNFSTSCM
jgi:hypothetical protein